MRSNPFLIVAGILLPLAWSQQDSGGLTARALYYREDAAAAPSTPAPKTTPAKPRTSAKRKSQAPAALPVAMHLGLRYNVIQVDSATGRSEEVDSKKVFHQGDCIALRLEANAPGYLYVLDQGSSGRWQALLPSAQMPEESNLLKAHSPTQVPAGYCFKFDNTPGTEKLFVALSQNVEAMQELDDTIRKGSGETMLAANVEQMRPELQSRDLVVQRVARPEASGEPAHAVYVVNAGNAPAKRIVAEIRLQHE